MKGPESKDEAGRAAPLLGCCAEAQEQLQVVVNDDGRGRVPSCPLRKQADGLELAHGPQFANPCPRMCKYVIRFVQFQLTLEK